MMFRRQSLLLLGTLLAGGIAGAEPAIVDSELDRVVHGKFLGRRRELAEAQ